MNFRILVLFFSLFAATVSNAQTQQDLNEAAFNDYKKTDEELNKTYQRLLALLNSADKQLLTKAEKNWITYRDSHCDFDVAQYEGGSIQPLMRYTCLESVPGNALMN